MKPEYMTAALCGYFQGSPSGRFSPARIREEMGITYTEWRHFAIHHLYPVVAIARRKLAEFGVSIVTESEPKQLGHNELMVTNFIKFPRNHGCLKQTHNA